MAISASSMPAANHAVNAGGRICTFTPAGRRPRACHGIAGNTRPEAPKAMITGIRHPAEAPRSRRMAVQSTGSAA